MILPVVQAGMQSFAPIDRRNANDWACAGNVVFPAAAPYTVTGPFSSDATRHWIEPLVSISKDTVRDVVIMAPPRSGKNVVADVWLPFIVATSPGVFQWLCSTEKIRNEYKEARIDNVLSASPSTRGLLPADPYKNTKHGIRFNHGMRLYTEFPSAANLQTKGVQFQVRDELWLWDEKLKEADARLGDFDEFESAKALTISQGGEEGGPFDSLVWECLQFEWTVECQFCGTFFVPVNTGHRKDGSKYGLIWDTEARDKLGDWNTARVVETMRYEPPCCGQPHIDSPRLKANWNRTGRWMNVKRGTIEPADGIDGNPRKHCFHISAAPIKKHSGIVENLVAAHNARRRGDISLLKQFTQKEDARNWSERALASARQIVIQNEPEKDKDGTVRIATVDVQSEWLWYSARAWEPGGMSRRLKFCKLFSWEGVHAVNTDLGIAANKCFVDSGFNSKGDTGVYAACCDFGWIPTKGDDAEFFLWPVKHPKTGRRIGSVQKSYAQPVLVDSERGRGGGENADRCYMIRYSTTTANGRLDGLQRRGFWQEPDADPEDPIEAQYLEQMASTILKNVRGKLQWVTINTNNHAWDLATMQILGAMLCDLLPDEYALKSEEKDSAE